MGRRNYGKGPKTAQNIEILSEFTDRAPLLNKYPRNDLKVSFIKYKISFFISI